MPFKQCVYKTLIIWIKIKWIKTEMFGAKWIEKE